MTNQSKCWNLSKTRCNQSKCWNLSEKGVIDQMLIFYCRSGNRSKSWNSIQEWGIVQNIEISGQRWESMKMLKFEC